MQKINHKAVFLIFILEMVFGFLWYSAAPASLLNATHSSLALSDMGYFLLVSFTLACLLLTYFSAWLLNKFSVASWSDRFLALVGIWMFCVLPNFIFISVYFDIEKVNIVYMLAFGFFCTSLNALILPLWRSSRSIFKS
ncbi:hypothetical protein [Marinomonas balearica]|uniref:Uncharacterized protein n=1 Tax=Marinomonas balearica TaxID=491947 RepID=A0A4R6M4Y2_9GAMM|nr:hypothetical protein [Marinomonas balearica]TDO96294.1 hypothetical protein DFP79_2867 [Marinomonas balearica]